MNVRADLIINAYDGDGCLYVQIEDSPTATKFTMIWSHEKGIPPYITLKDLAKFILTKGKPE